MPELPEAEHARARIERWLGGRTLTAARALDGLVVRRPSGAAMRPTEFEDALVGAQVGAVSRRGKRIVLGLDGDRALGLTLGMSGHPYLVGADGPLPPHTRWSITAGDRQLALADPRRFSRATVGLRAEVESFLGIDQLGPEPTETSTGPELAARFPRTKGPIQAALMDQARIAGLGNIHAAEALFLARIRPSRAVPTLRPEEWRALASGITKALKRAAIPVDEDLVYATEGGPRPFLVYGREGEPCTRCKTAIRRAVAQGRSSYFCPSCQPAR